MELPTNSEAILQGQGWNIEHLRLGDVRWAAATLSIPTICGDRQAVIYFDGKRWSAGYGGHPLEAHFMPHDGDLLAYLSALYSIIDQTYARRLLLSS